MKSRILAVSICLLLCLSVFKVSAQGVKEVLGPVYRIAEQDFLEYIMTHLKEMESTGALEQFQKKVQGRARRYTDRPTPANRVVKTVEPKTKVYDPSITVPYDLIDHQGQVLHRAGTQVSPLRYTQLSSHLLFFDGDDPEQVAWAKNIGERYQWRVKSILVSGSPTELMNHWQRRVYFDQQGFLVNKLGIEQVPAIAYQDGDVLRIDEVMP